MQIRAEVDSVWNRVIVALFIDSIWLHTLWQCHRLPERSFNLRGRQFHVCSRCTGIISGMLISPILIPVRHQLLLVFWFSVIIMLIDGLTQLLKLRTSNNCLRLSTGICLGLTTLPTLLTLGGF